MNNGGSHFLYRRERMINLIHEIIEQIEMEMLGIK